MPLFSIIFISIVALICAGLPTLLVFMFFYTRNEVKASERRKAPAPASRQHPKSRIADAT